MRPQTSESFAMLPNLLMEGHEDINVLMSKDFFALRNGLPQVVEHKPATVLS